MRRTGEEWVTDRKSGGQVMAEQVEDRRGKTGSVCVCMFVCLCDRERESVCELLRMCVCDQSRIS